MYEEPVIALDVLPTVLTAAGAPIPADCDGVDLLPHLTGATATPPHAALYWRFGPQKAVRSGQWKLVDWRDFDTRQNSGWQFYDLSQDIGEQHDLAASQPEVVARLTHDWEEWNTKNVEPLWHGSWQEDPTAPMPPAAKR